MKRMFLFLAIALTAVFVISCPKKDTVQANPGMEITQLAAAAGMKQGYALIINAGFYTMDENTGAETDLTKWTASMSLGQRLAVGEERKATYSQNSTVYNYIEVQRDNGSKGFALASQVAAGGNLAVVVDEKGANLFRSASTIDVSTVILSYKTVIVYYPETEKDGYVQIRGYDPERRAYIQADNNFVRLSALSTRNSDVQSSILLQTALLLKDEGQEKVRRDALLESALLDHSDSVFYAEILAVANPNTEGEVHDEALMWEWD